MSTKLLARGHGTLPPVSLEPETSLDRQSGRRRDKGTVSPSNGYSI